MNRRNFLASVLLIPAALKAAIYSKPKPEQRTVILDEPERHLIVQNFHNSFRDLNAVEAIMLGEDMNNGCSLANARIAPLTPSELIRMCELELDQFRKNGI